jgi:hypothetical protein
MDSNELKNFQDVNDIPFQQPERSSSTKSHNLGTSGDSKFDETEEELGQSPIPTSPRDLKKRVYSTGKKTLKQCLAERPLEKPPEPPSAKNNLFSTSPTPSSPFTLHQEGSRTERWESKPMRRKSVDKSLSMGIKRQTSLGAVTGRVHAQPKGNQDLDANGSVSELSITGSIDPDNLSPVSSPPNSSRLRSETKRPKSKSSQKESKKTTLNQPVSPKTPPPKTKKELKKESSTESIKQRVNKNPTLRPSQLKNQDQISVSFQYEDNSIDISEISSSTPVRRNCMIINQVDVLPDR